MGQFSLDSSDIISGFDGILKKHSLDFFFLQFLSEGKSPEWRNIV